MTDNTNILRRNRPGTRTSVSFFLYLVSVFHTSTQSKMVLLHF